MADFPLFGESEALEHGFVQATVLGTNVTSSASADTKGAWVELVSAANNLFDSSVEVCLSFNSSTNSSFLIDIGVGGAASEEVIVSNLWCNTTSVAAHSSDFVKMPIIIPAGQRVSARCQSDEGSRIIPVYIKLISSDFMQPTSASEVISIGDDAATTSGVTVTTTTAGTFGSWVEIDASLGDNIKGFFVAAHRNTPTSWSNLRVAYQVSVGSAGNEEVIFDSQIMVQLQTEAQSSHFSSVSMISIASGERVAIRAVSSVTNTDADFDYVIYGIK